ncbi:MULTISPECIES: single-stranded DNA-binding protein [unclassified Imperialibacter]|uniref:single-stranded DNA-binding protein n=1 Tax=unclassified Imperialibacter TaxID=2629706 RepID=UPI001259B52D|nr:MULTISPECIES: single-stranded DNA-binding protein [unclassified Imperialibacter]CAD5267586.1 Single-stranded DNA-binding protein 1 [Imperialibacter sp. 89]CAD5296016.1 Single-stranded DNA-binding protein 1 [Imperialibacter sp. 75]VVT33700.1 Single-stranded DNA-binding protein 1 [Imperialibacter sp. EC-SDR9]
MSGVNKVILLGNLGKDPEIRHLENGRAVTNFTLATSEVYKNKEGNKVTNTEWHNVVLWTPLAEVAEKYLKKGNQVYIEGKITTRSYDDKDGNKRYITEVVGREMTLVGGRPDGGGVSSEPQSGGAAQPAPVAAEPTDLDDLPF